MYCTVNRWHGWFIYEIHCEFIRSVVFLSLHISCHHSPVNLFPIKSIPLQNALTTCNLHQIGYPHNTMQAHPSIPLQALLDGHPVDYSLDKYPPPWAEIFTALQSTPPIPHLRQAVLATTIATLSDSALDQLERSLIDPLALAHHIKFTERQELVITALKYLGQSRASHIALAIRRDRSNIHHDLQSLVSLGIVARHKVGQKILYRLRQPSPSEEPPHDPRHN